MICRRRIRRWAAIKTLTGLGYSVFADAKANFKDCNGHGFAKKIGAWRILLTDKTRKTMWIIPFDHSGINS